MIRAFSLAYQANPATVVASLDHLPWLMALDSGCEAHPDRRYDIITADPLLKISADHQVTRVICGDAIVEETRGCPFAVLEQLLQRYTLKPHEVPFQAGLMGYFAYDLAYRLHPLNRRIQPDVDAPLMAVGLYDWSIVTDHVEQTTTCYWVPGWAPGSQGEREQQLTSVLELLQAKPHAVSENDDFTLTPFTANMSQSEYGQSLTQIRNHLHAGNAYQVNFAQRLSAHYSGDPKNLYYKLRHSGAMGPFSALMQFDETTVVSVSPERFVQYDGEQVYTNPIKGTIRRGENEQDDLEQRQRLQASEKDQAENLMIVDLMRNDLGKVCKPGSIKVDQLFGLETFKTVHHLVSRIRGTLAEGETALSLLKSIFPGGSITGAPKLSAMQIIEDLEPNQRHVYCGSIGYIDASGKMDTNIAIRSLVATQGQLHFWGGGGIVIDSQIEAEYQETLAKVGSFLGLFEL